MVAFHPNRLGSKLNSLRPSDAHYGNQSRGFFIVTTRCVPALQPGPPSQTPGGLGQSYWSVSEVTWPQKSGVSEVGVFRALWPYVFASVNLPSLVHMTVVAWSAPSHYLKQYWNIVNWTLRNKIQWNLNRNSHIFIHKNGFENIICKMAAILPGPQCVTLKKIDTQ